MKVMFEGCVFDSDTRELLRNSRPASLTPKAFALLEILVRERPRAVSKTEIHDFLWPGTFVSESALGNLVAELRRALGDDARHPRIIRTVPRYGYAFSAEAANHEAPGAEPSLPVDTGYRLILGQREIALDRGENLIGRERSAVLWVDDSSVSRCHARVRIDDTGATLEDLGSKNGTFLNGKRIDASVRLADRDAVEIGPVSIVFRVLQSTGSTQSSIGKRASR